MPGIVTHNKIFQEAVRQLNNRKKKNYLHRSIFTLLSQPEFRKAALFGALGPDIFDAIPSGRNKRFFGSKVSHDIHDGDGAGVFEYLLNQIFEESDPNNEWNAARRAYLYGFAAHMITDSVFYPFIFYFSGFPSGPQDKNKHIIREQNLLFQYNLDQYYQFYEEKTSELRFVPADMIPVTGKGRLKRLPDPLRNLLLNMLKNLYPETYRRVILVKNKNNSEYLTMLDFLPWTLEKIYRYKRSSGRGFTDDINKYLRKNNFYTPDFLVRYPSGRKFNSHALNHHKDRWQNPGGPPGLRYESVDNLFSEAWERVIGIWEDLERSVYEGPDYSISEKLSFNSYTGGRNSFYSQMKHQSPLRLRF